jgi:hypothetical protein
MKVNVLKRIQVAKGTKIVVYQPNTEADLPDSIAREYLRSGAVELYETKVIRQDPLPGAGEITQSSASPAAQVSTKTTSKKSGSGGKKKTAQ